MTYSWIAFPGDAHEKLIWQATRRVTTIPRPPWKALGEENSDLSVHFLFRQYFEKYIE